MPIYPTAKKPSWMTPDDLHDTPMIAGLKSFANTLGSAVGGDDPAGTMMGVASPMMAADSEMGPLAKKGLEAVNAAGAKVGGWIKNMPGFYSRLTRAAEALPESAVGMHPNKMLAAINKYHEGVNPEELQYRGLTDLLKGKGNNPITKGEVLSHLEQNPVPEVGTKVYGEPRTADPGSPEEFQRWLHENYGPRAGNLDFNDATMQEWHDEFLNSPTRKDNATTYHQYQVPGSIPRSYRERLTTLPTKPTNEQISDWRIIHQNEYSPEELDFVTQHMNDGDLNYINQLRDESKGNYQSSHWPNDPNVLVHERWNDRMIPGRLPESFKVLSGSDENFNPGSWVEGYLPDPTNTIRGKRFYQGPSAKTPEEAMRKAAMDKEFASKGRLIENVQSDWHQAGAKEGYQSPTGPQGLEPTQQALTEAYKHMSDSEDRVLELERQYPNAYLEDDTFPEELQKALDDAARARMNHENIRARFNELARMDPQVPDAPFKQSWPDLALKRQVLDVANSPDLEWLGITPGEELVGRGEGQSPVFHNEILPNKLMKILKPFGGKVEKIGEVPRSKVPDIDYAGLGHIRSTNTDYIPGDETHIADLWPPYKYDYEKGPANMQGERASEQRRGYELADLVRNSQRNTRPFKGAHFSPDLKALIKKNGLSYMSLLGLIGAGKALDNQDDSEVR